MSPKKIELEAALENRCVAKIEARGGLALKLSIPGVRGFPDRTCLVPRNAKTPMQPGEWRAVDPRGPVVFFIEVKRIKTGVVSKQQHRWRALLFQAGFNVYFIDTDAGFDQALEKELNR